MNKDVLGRCELSIYEVKRPRANQSNQITVSSLSTRIDSLETSIGELMSGSNGDGDSTSTS